MFLGTKLEKPERVCSPAPKSSERGQICQNRPFTKRPFCFLSSQKTREQRPPGPKSMQGHHLSGGANYLPKFLPISFLRRVSRFIGVFETFGPPIRKILVYTGMLPCLALHGLKLCKSVSRSDLVLISFWMLTMSWIFYLISLFRRASRFILFSTKVAPECFCLVRLKKPLLICFG